MFVLFVVQGEMLKDVRTHLAVNSWNGVFTTEWCLFGTRDQSEMGNGRECFCDNERKQHHLVTRVNNLINDVLAFFLARIQQTWRSVRLKWDDVLKISNSHFCDIKVLPGDCYQKTIEHISYHLLYAVVSFFERFNEMSIPNDSFEMKTHRRFAFSKGIASLSGGSIVNVFV